jgi:hypothetical protein
VEGTGGALDLHPTGKDEGACSDAPPAAHRKLRSRPKWYSSSRISGSSSAWISAVLDPAGRVKSS